MVFCCIRSLVICISLIYVAEAFITPQPTTCINRYHQKKSTTKNRAKSPLPSSVLLQSAPSSSSEVTSSSLRDGIEKTIITKSSSITGENTDVRMGDIATVKFSCYIADDDDKTRIPFAKSNLQKVMVGDGSMIAGWDIGLTSMKVGERSIFRITNPELGYGSNGFEPIIPPNSNIEIDLEVLEVTEPMDFESLPFADPLTPRTASSIAAAYDERQRAKSLEPQKEGLEAWIDKAKNFYFFGFFEGETGEKAPWFLRPSITFPIAFAIVGLTFYIAYIGGGITERGTPTRDELDELITMTTTSSSTILALLLSSTTVNL